MRWGRLIRITLWSLAATVASLGTVAGAAYVTDAGVDATVLSRRCDTLDPGELASLPPLAQLARQASLAGEVEVRTLLGVHYTRHLDALSCSAVVPGNVVVYHLRSGRTSIYQDASKAVCVFDTLYGENGCSK